ncbi:MAG: glutamate formimidoyltransferase [Deltaproteobacteria bacterium]|nr:glutamate formimidoyltransferase [Deltaproteobacteria bacterium]
MKVLECIPNISEGKDKEKIDRILSALKPFEAVKCLNVSSDKDHNRSVITLLGPAEDVPKAMMALALAAIEQIDMQHHRGSHPRIGAVDVVPFVPIRGMEMSEAVEIAHRFGKELGEKAGIPVYFYEEAALREDRRNLADVRRGQYEGLPEKLKRPDGAPDAGVAEFNPEAGATIVGARPPLIAFNVNLHTNDKKIADAIARAVRYKTGGFKAVKAMGVALEDKGMVQVSMNLVNFKETPIHRVVETIRFEAARYGVQIAECELIGLTPMASLEEIVRFYLQIPDFSVDQIIESHLLP